MSDPGATAVSATLDELERKLRELEAELHFPDAAGPAPAPPPVPAPVAAPAPAPTDPGERLVADARSRLRALGEQIDGLQSFRSDLERIARELEAEYGRTLGRFVPAEPPTPPPAPLEGTVVVDAGPFADLAALTAFEQALGGAPGVEDVYVSGFEDRRATIELRLSAPTALDDLVAGELAIRVAAVRREAGGLAVDVRPEPPS